MRNPFECLRSMGAEFDDTAILCTTLTLPDEADLIRETVFSLTGSDGFARPNTMLFGFFTSTLFVLIGLDFVWGFALLLVFTAMYVLDSDYAILSAMYCWKRSRTPSNGMRWKIGSKNPSTTIFSASACGIPRDFK